MNNTSFGENEYINLDDFVGWFRFMLEGALLPIVVSFGLFGELMYFKNKSNLNFNIYFRTKVYKNINNTL